MYLRYFLCFNLSFSKSKQNKMFFKGLISYITPGVGKTKKYHGFLSSTIVDHVYKKLINYKENKITFLQEETNFFMGQDFKNVVNQTLKPSLTLPTKNGKMCFWYHYEVSTASIFFANTANLDSSIHVVLMLKFDEKDTVVDEILTIEIGGSNMIMSTFSPC